MGREKGHATTAAGPSGVVTVASLTTGLSAVRFGGRGTEGFFDEALGFWIVLPRSAIMNGLFARRFPHDEEAGFAS
jgi:hypothetical protein